MTLQEERDALLDMMKLMVQPDGWTHLVEAHNLIVDIDPEFGEKVVEKWLRWRTPGSISIEGAPVETFTE